MTKSKIQTNHTPLPSILVVVGILLLFKWKILIEALFYLMSHSKGQELLKPSYCEQT